MSHKTTAYRRSAWLGRTALAAAAAAGILAAAPAVAQDVKIGALFGVTGGLANYIPPIQAGAELAIKQVNDAGGVLDGRKLDLIIGDTQATAQVSVDAANKLVNVNNVTAIVGALASGATIAAANSATVPAGVLMISPASTSPAITDLKDNDYLFRVVPSDAYQGKMLAKLLLREGIKKVALTYINNDYGVGLAGAFRTNYTAGGGTITGDQSHEPKKSSYRSELATLSSGHPDALVLIAYSNDSGPTMIRQSLENGFFTKFIGTDGLRDPKMVAQLGGKNLEGMIFSTPGEVPGTSAADKLTKAFTAYDPDSVGKPYAAQTYDATFLIALAIEKAGSTDRTAVRDALRAVANPPGVVIEPGEWAKAKKLIDAGKDINYEGATGPQDFDAQGEVAAVIDEWMIKGGKLVKVGQIK